MPTVEAPPRPFREGLMTVTPPRLVGSRCDACGITVFPKRQVCPGCRASGTSSVVELPPSGEIYSFTVVRQAPAGIEVSYVLAYVDLPGGTRVLSQCSGVAPEDVEIGMPVHLELAPAGRDADGRPLVAYRFRGEQRGQA